MKILPSLRGRIFVTSALLTVLSIGVAISVVNVRVARETERELQRQVVAAGALVESLRSTRTDTSAVMARLIADLPKLKAAVETNDPPTVQDIAEELGMTHSAVSHQLGLLSSHDIVSSKKDGRLVHYRVSSGKEAKALTKFLAALA